MLKAFYLPEIHQSAHLSTHQEVVNILHKQEGLIVEEGRLVCQTFHHNTQIPPMEMEALIQSEVRQQEVRFKVLHPHILVLKELKQFLQKVNILLVPSICTVPLLQTMDIYLHFNLNIPKLQGDNKVNIRVFQGRIAIPLKAIVLPLNLQDKDKDLGPKEEVLLIILIPHYISKPTVLIYNNQINSYRQLSSKKNLTMHKAKVKMKNKKRKIDKKKIIIKINKILVMCYNII